MAQPVYVYDPTAADALSKVRGIGRYMQILQENANNKFRFVSNLHTIPADSVFINPFFNIIQNPLITKRIAKRQIAIIHDLIPLKYPAHFPIGIKGAIRVFNNKRLLKLYDHVITDSQASKRDIVKMLKVPNEKISVVYPCLPANFAQQANTPLSPSYKLRANSYLIYVGDVTWNKNIVMIARAVKRANATCVFVGRAFATMNTAPKNVWNAEVRQFAQIVAGDSRFIFPGFIDNDLLMSFYKHAAANILISQDEGFGFSYLEAASQKTPSLLADIPVFREIAGDAAVYANQNSEEDVARAMQTFLDSPEHRTQIGKSAYKRAATYSRDQFTQSLQTILNSPL